MGLIQGLAITLYNLLTAKRRTAPAPDLSFLLDDRTVSGSQASLNKVSAWGSKHAPDRELAWYRMADPLAYGHILQSA